MGSKFLKINRSNSHKGLHSAPCQTLGYTELYIDVYVRTLPVLVDQVGEYERGDWGGVERCTISTLALLSPLSSSPVLVFFAVAARNLIFFILLALAFSSTRKEMRLTIFRRNKGWRLELDNCLVHDEGRLKKCRQIFFVSIYWI